LEFNTKIPIYIQVIDDFKKKLVRGDISLGDKLPSVRELAGEYTINPNTAARVYREMEQQGLCFTKRGLGTFITEDEAVLKGIREQMALGYAAEFLEGMKSLGIDYKEAMRLLKEVQEAPNDAKHHL